MEEQGKIYAGSAAKPKGRPWVYGQFSATVLPAACHLLATSSLRAAERSNPVKVRNTRWGAQDEGTAGPC